MNKPGVLGLCMVLAGCAVDGGDQIEATPKGLAIQLLDTAGAARTTFEVGEGLLVASDGLAPAHGYQVVVLSDQGEAFRISLVTDVKGTLAPTLLWPDLGLGTSKAELFSYARLEDAQAKLGGRKFVVELLDGDKVVTKAPFTIDKQSARTRIFSSDKSGKPLHGLTAGSDDLWITAQNVPAGAALDVTLVREQVGWQSGDPIVPALDNLGQPITQRVQLDKDATSFAIMLAQAPVVQSGRFQILMRPVVDKIANWKPFTAADTMSDRLITTVVIRPGQLDHDHPIVLVSAHDIAGRGLPGAPGFETIDTFEAGTGVSAALDPAALPPDAIGRKVRFYVIAHKSPADWRASTALTDVTGNTVELVTRADSIGSNCVLVWAAAVPGDYDLVVDFGNNADDPARFMADDSFDSARDLIDGYYRIGFRVTEDLSQPGHFAIGQTTYAEAPLDLADPGGTPASWPETMNVHVRYPADVAGTDVGVSTAHATYPLVVVMHGQLLGYDGYDYLLDHLASHGYIAASIDCNDIPGWAHAPITVYANCMLAYLSVLAGKQTAPGVLHGALDLARIAIIGHSRGGDGVVEAEALNRSEGLGWHFSAVISIAPTDGSGATLQTPYLCLYGSNDGDVGQWAGFPFARHGSGFRIYDRARGEKAMVFIRDATHNLFNSLMPSELTNSPGAVYLARDQHEDFARGYIAAFLALQLDGRTEQRDYFSGNLSIPAVATLPIRRQYGAAPASTLVVDDFEGATPYANRLGGEVSSSGFDSVRIDLLGALDNSSPHQTRGAKMRWVAPAASYRTAIPAAHRDLSSYGVLSLRVGQTYGYVGSMSDDTVSSELDRGLLSVRTRTQYAFTNVDLSAAATVTSTIPGSQWRIEDGGDGHIFILKKVWMTNAYIIQVWRDGAQRNRPGADQDFAIRLTSGDGSSRSIAVGTFAELRYPDRPVATPDDWDLDDMRTLASLQTVRIPLAAWSLTYPGAAAVDLSDVTSISLDFGATRTGELLIDDLELAP